MYNYSRTIAEWIHIGRKYVLVCVCEREMKKKMRRYIENIKANNRYIDTWIDID